MLVVILLYMAFAPCAQAATVHGTIYEWSDFETPLKNAIVEVNSTPAQYMVSTDGTYSFNISSGNYLIQCKYYQNNVLEYITEEEIEIDGDGIFVLDLLLFPPTESEYEFLGDINLTGDMSIDDYPNSASHAGYYLILIFVLLLLTFWFSSLLKSRDIKSRNNPGAVDDNVDVTDELPEENVRLEMGAAEVTGDFGEGRKLPDDLGGLYDMILHMGGRVTQKDLRKKVPYSEAKVSLMLADLEDRGFIRKIKKGRSNIIIARD